jgi:hypothetical protein
VRFFLLRCSIMETSAVRCLIVYICVGRKRTVRASENAHATRTDRAIAYPLIDGLFGQVVRFEVVLDELLVRQRPRRASERERKRERAVEGESGERTTHLRSLMMRSKRRSNCSKSSCINALPWMVHRLTLAYLEGRRGWLVGQ